MSFFKDLADTIALWCGYEPLTTKESIAKLKKEIEEYKDELANLRIENTGLKGSLNEVRKAEKESARNADVAVDWEGMRVRSVERLVDGNNNEKTVIGFIDHKGALSSNWCFYCTIEKHNQLVTEFKEYLKSLKVKE